MCIDKYEFLVIGGKERRIDSCIVPIVRALNDGGVDTIASCCGHFNQWGTIILRDGRELLIVPDWESGRAFDKIHGRPIHDKRRALMKAEVTAPTAEPSGLWSSLADNTSQAEIAALLRDWDAIKKGCPIYKRLSIY